MWAVTKINILSHIAWLHHRKESHSTCSMERGIFYFGQRNAKLKQTSKLMNLWMIVIILCKHNH